MRLLLVCPGRGSYGREQLGSLPGASPTIGRLDAIRRELGRPTLTELDSMERFSVRRHLAGEHASLLTAGATLADLEALDRERHRVVAVVGNSMGWYTALHAAGALDLDDAARLVETLGSYQADGVLGGQVLYPVCDEDWRVDSGLVGLVREELSAPGVHLSIRLGGSVVLAGDDDTVRRLLRELPSIERGRHRYPLQLPLHSAFHTPLLAGASEGAARDLRDLRFGSPRVPLVDGRGLVHRLHADPEALRRYTLGEQVVDTFDFTAAVRVALCEYAPDAVLLPGPGGSLGSAIAQVMIELGWQGIRSRDDFMAAQSGDSPVLLSMARPEQRALVAM